MSRPVAGSGPRFGALVRRKRDGRVAIDLDLVHAGVVTEVVLQTRALLAGDAEPEPGSGARGGLAVPGDLGEPATTGSGSAARDGSAAGSGSVDEEFAAIVSGLSAPGGDGTGEGIGEVSDPALRRLLPDAYPGDAAASAEFRRLSADSVLGRKVAAMDAVLADLAVLRRQQGGLVVDAGRARSWLTTLNDARLALGTRLAVTEEDDLEAELEAYETRLLSEPEAADADEPAATRAYRIAVYGFLSELLEMTVRALDR